MVWWNNLDFGIVPIFVVVFLSFYNAKLFSISPKRWGSATFDWFYLTEPFWIKVVPTGEFCPSTIRSSKSDFVDSSINLNIEDIYAKIDVLSVYHCAYWSWKLFFEKSDVIDALVLTLLWWSCPPLVNLDESLLKTLLLLPNLSWPFWGACALAFVIV